MATNQISKASNRQSLGVPADSGRRTSLRELLADYDREVMESLRTAFDADTGLERARILHEASRVITVHDAVLVSALCPLLEDLPGGQEVASRLRHGSEERAVLLRRFADVAKNVAAQNVYPVSGDAIEEILEGLEQSLDAHVTDETQQVGEVLTASSESVDPDVVAARMALVAEDSPTRSHRATPGLPHSPLQKRYYRLHERWADWRDAHHGWLENGSAAKTPRVFQATRLMSAADAGPPTIGEVLAGYDKSVDEMIAEQGAATNLAEEAVAVQRLSAAIAIHDSVLAGVLCPLLDALPEAKEPAAKLREGCHRRGELQRQLADVMRRVVPGESDETLRATIAPLVEALIESFGSHKSVETGDVAALLRDLPDDAYRTKGSLLNDAMWPWHSEGPELLALRMAMWARSSPSRSHRLLESHPSSRALRSWYRLADHGRHISAETPFERWLAPKRPNAPFESLRTTPEGAPQTPPAASGLTDGPDESDRDPGT
jgi:hypothetical protein